MKSDLRKLFDLVVSLVWRPGAYQARRSLLLAITMLIASRLTHVAPPFLYKAIVDILLVTFSAQTNTALSVRQNGFAICLALVIALAGLKVLHEIFCRIRDNNFATLASRGVTNISKDLYERILRQPFNTSHAVNVGLPISICQRSRSAVEDLLRLAFVGLGPTILEILALLVIFGIFIGFKFAVILLFSTAIFISITILDMNRRIDIRAKLNQHEESMSSFIAISSSNSESIKAYNAEYFQVSQFEKISNNYGIFLARSLITLANLNFKQSVVLIIAMLASMVAMISDVARGTATVGDFVFLNVALMQLFVPLQNLGMQYRVARQSVHDLKEAIEILDGPIEQDDSATKPCLHISKAELNVRNLSYGHDNSGSTLANVSVHFPGGKVTCLLGPSGAGKSTLVRLVTRLFDPSEAEIFIDGQDVTSVSRNSVRQAVTYVSQDGSLFDGTIRENVSFGSWGSDDSAIGRALEAAQLLEFVQNLPQGLNTPIGDRGLKLSGGERQRITIARCLLRNSPILILDEVTSALDLDTEKRVLSAIKKWRSGKTTVMICHRLSVLEIAEVVVVLPMKGPPLQGTHCQLLERSDNYRDYIRAHFGFLDTSAAGMEYRTSREH